MVNRIGCSEMKLHNDDREPAWGRTGSEPIRWRRLWFQQTQTAVGETTVSAVSPWRWGADGINRLAYMTCLCRAGHSTSHGGAAAGYCQRRLSLNHVSLGEAARDRVQRSNPLLGIVREFLFEGDMSCCHGNSGYELCPLNFSWREKLTSPLKLWINTDTKKTDNHMDN